VSWLGCGTIDGEHLEAVNVIVLVLGRVDTLYREPEQARPCGLISPNAERDRICDDVGRIVGYHHVAEHEPSGRPEPVGDAGEEVRLTCTVEVVHGERRHDEVEGALG
jgi:hypothetical protein